MFNADCNLRVITIYIYITLEVIYNKLTPLQLLGFEISPFLVNIFRPPPFHLSVLAVPSKYLELILNNTNSLSSLRALRAFGETPLSPETICSVSFY